MLRSQVPVCLLALTGLACGLPDAAMAHDGAGTVLPQASQAGPRPTEPTLDPAVRALLLALTASVLREAAASPDPMPALASSLERKLLFALRSPEFARLAKSVVGEAVKDAPDELREPLAAFALAMLNNIRQEMLNEARARRPR